MYIMINYPYAFDKYIYLFEILGNDGIYSIADPLSFMPN